MYQKDWKPAGCWITVTLHFLTCSLQYIQTVSSFRANDNANPSGPNRRYFNAKQQTGLQMKAALKDPRWAAYSTMWTVMEGRFARKWEADAWRKERKPWRFSLISFGGRCEERAGQGRFGQSRRRRRNRKWRNLYNWMRLKLFLREKKVWGAVDKTKLLCTEKQISSKMRMFPSPNFIHKLLFSRKKNYYLEFTTSY